MDGEGASKKRRLAEEDKAKSEGLAAEEAAQKKTLEEKLRWETAGTIVATGGQAATWGALVLEKSTSRLRVYASPNLDGNKKAVRFLMWGVQEIQ